MRLAPFTLTTVLLAVCSLVQAQPPDLARELIPYWQPGDLGHIEVGFNTPPEADEDAALALELRDAKTPDEALAIVNAKLAAGAGSRGRMLSRRAAVQLQMGRTEPATVDLLEARTCLESEIQAAPGDEGLRFELAQVHLALDAPDRAKQVLREAVESDPTMGVCLVFLAALEEESVGALVAAAEQALQDRLAANPADERTAFAAATVAGLRERTPEQEERLRELSRQRKYAELSDELGIVRILRTHLDAAPESHRARWGLASAHAVVAGMALTSRGGALTQLARDGDPAMAEFLAPVGELLSDLDENPEAELLHYGPLLPYYASRADAAGLIDALRRASERFPEDAAVRIRHAEAVLELTGDSRKALELAEAASGDLRVLDARACLAWIKFRAGETTEAGDRAGSILNDLQDGAPAVDAPGVLRRCLLILAADKVLAGDTETAAALLATATENAPGPEVAIDMAITLAVAGDVAGSKELLAQVAEERRDDAVSRDLLTLLKDR